MIKSSCSRKVFVVFNTIILLTLIIITLYPVWYVLCASFSSYTSLMLHRGFLFLPKGFTIGAYNLLLQNPMVFYGFRNTLIIVVCSLVLNLTLTTLGAYFLTRKNVFWQNYIMMAIVFTMYFSGGLIPTYFTVRQLGLDGTLLALIIPGAISSYNLIILRTAFAAVPNSLDESARLDGAGHLCTIKNIYIPLTLPSLLVITLYYFVAHWNSWFSATIYIRKRTLFPLQLVLREILIQNSTEDMLIGTSGDQVNQVSEQIKYALIIVSIIPVLCLYPIIQKFFVKGVMIGAVKG